MSSSDPLTRCYTIWTAIRPHVRRTIRRILRHHAAHLAVVATVVCVGGPLVVVGMLPPAVAPEAVPGVQAVPEPGDLALLPGLVVVAVLKRRVGQ